MRNPKALSSLIPLVVLVALSGVAACSGEKGPVGPKGETGQAGEQGPPGDPGSPDTATQVLDKVSEVDGDGSGLDADRLDGLDGADFARAGLRALQLAPQGGTLVDASQQWVFGRILMPNDMAPETSVTIRMWYSAASSPCWFAVQASVMGFEGRGYSSFGDAELVAVPDRSEKEYAVTIPADPALAGGSGSRSPSNACSTSPATIVRG